MATASRPAPATPTPAGPGRAGSRAVRESVRRAEAPAFSCWADGTVLNWNRAAEAVFGVAAGEAKQRKCWEIVAGIDVFGNDYCSRSCPIRVMARRGRSIRPFRVIVHDAGGSRLVLRNTVLVIRDDGGRPELVHLMDPLTPAEPARRTAFP